CARDPRLPRGALPGSRGPRLRDPRVVRDPLHGEVSAGSVRVQCRSDPLEQPRARLRVPPRHRRVPAVQAGAMSELAVLQVVGSEPEAEIILSLLRSEGIPAIAQKTNFAVGLADASSSSAGPREILVHAENLARAREILEDQPEL